MKTLIEIAIELTEDCSSEGQDVHRLYSRYIEILIVSNPIEIKEMLDYMRGNYFLELPLGCLLISWRILCLLEPENMEYKELAKKDTSLLTESFWDNKIKW